MENEKTGYGLALGGGGSLGAYSIGVWKAIKQTGIRITRITGTSIGAIIGALVITDDIDKAVGIWENITPSKVFRHGINLEIGELKKTFRTDRARLKKLAHSMIENKGIDISPFIRLLEDSLDLHKIKTSGILFGVTATSLPLLEKKDVLIQSVEENQIIPWLLASSAIWPFFPVPNINGVSYVDGGIRDNLPVRLNFTLGAGKVIAVNHFPRWPGVSKLRKNKDVILIEPSHQIGGLGNVLDFRTRIIKKNISLGYLDGMKVLGGYIGSDYTFFSGSRIAADLGGKLIKLLSEEYKPSMPGIMKILKGKKYASMTDEMIFIRSVEELAGVFSVSPYKVHDLDGLTFSLYKKLTGFVRTGEAVSLLRKIKGEISLTKKEEKMALGALKYILENQNVRKGVRRIPLTKDRHILLSGLVFTLYEYYNGQKN